MTIVRTEFRVFLMEQKDRQDLERLMKSLERSLEGNQVLCVQLTVEQRNDYKGLERRVEDGGPLPPMPEMQEEFQKE